MKKQNLLALPLIATIIAACSSGNSGPTTPQYLPQGNYSVRSFITSKNLVSLPVCTILNAPIPVVLSKNIASSDGKGNVLLTTPFGQQASYTMDLHKNPCGTVSIESDTYTFSDCQRTESGIFTMFTFDKNNSHIWESAGCVLATNFDPQK